jgi:hypothetical protein
MNPTITKRISRNKYNNNNNNDKTYQETLTNEQIKEYLNDYSQVEDIKQIGISTHLRYFTIDSKTNKKLFRLGGYLNKFGDNGEYIILSNGNLSWSVQIKNSIFYKKMTDKELKEEIKQEILTETQNQMISEFEDLKKEYKNIEKKYKNLDKKYKELEEINLIKEKDNKNLEKDNISLSKKNEFLNDQLENIKKEILKIKNKK